MAAIPDFTSYAASIELPTQRIPFTLATLATGTRNFQSYWTAATTSSPAGATAPSTAAVPARDAVGAFGQLDGSTGQLRVLLTELQGSVNGLLVIADRLSHQGGLSGVTTGAQTTNLPTAALTRYTDGVGVFAGLEIYSAVGVTGVTATVSYTDQGGNAAQSSVRNFGATGFREANTLIPLPLASGDTGVRSVESVTLSATTGTAGNFGVTLFRPLFAVPIINDRPVSVDPFITGATLPPEILDGACLVPLVFAPLNGSVTGSLTFCED